MTTLIWDYPSYPKAPSGYLAYTPKQELIQRRSETQIPNYQVLWTLGATFILPFESLISLEPALHAIGLHCCHERHRDA